MDIPMMNEEEYAIAYELYRKGMHNKSAGKDQTQRFKELIDFYKDLSGIEETNPNAIIHHRLADFGPDCPSCQKPLRTKVARYCAACGFGKDDFTSQDTKPLVERRSELFKD